MHRDNEIIQKLGGPAKVAELLHFTKPGGIQRVQNWTRRGIPPRVLLEHRQLFEKAQEVV